MLGASSALLGVDLKAAGLRRSDRKERIKQGPCDVKGIAGFRREGSGMGLGVALGVQLCCSRSLWLGLRASREAWSL